MYNIGAKSEDFELCVDEQAFKKLYCTKYLKHKFTGVTQKIFCIETEETIAGFPDVMELMTSKGGVTTVQFYEFKASDRYGNIEFQKTQPPFYRSNKELDIRVIAYNRKSQRVHLFSTDEIFNKESVYYTTNRRINLAIVEKELGI